MELFIFRAQSDPFSFKYIMFDTSLEHYYLMHYFKTGRVKLQPFEIVEDIGKNAVFFLEIFLQCLSVLKKYPSFKHTTIQPLIFLSNFNKECLTG